MMLTKVRHALVSFYKHDPSEQAKTDLLCLNCVWLINEIVTHVCRTVLRLLTTVGSLAQSGGAAQSASRILFGCHPHLTCLWGATRTKLLGTSLKSVPRSFVANIGSHFSKFVRRLLYNTCSVPAASNQLACHRTFFYFFPTLTKSKKGRQLKPKVN